MKTVSEMLAEADREMIVEECNFTATALAACKAFDGEKLRRHADTATRALIVWLLDPSKPFDRGERRMLASVLAGEWNLKRGRTSKKGHEQRADTAFLEMAKAIIDLKVKTATKPLKPLHAEDDVCEKLAHRRGWTPETMKRYLHNSEKSIVRKRVNRNSR